ncbi:Modulator of FtsH protease YccA [Candidatus Kinetoplastibacterium sorsogonicusi]|uniref:Modulator of FtsH protease YccA n=1 Tax=Candidatus Kinetoplastidibacterium kentomonadis TaxID=1576550 RepID=A0A3S7JA58_9PROT|nr:Bax inhibitor-1 family protein [Candidatus Kinetoplastibacterium sorsogonicusi]AWD32549.1 Modulator of FtsH protease YccA [Candidatus Kinetoplastibacterium sorsogonicusi]
MNDYSTNKKYIIIENDGSIKNKVLRNTYLLLSISLIPTVLGAAIGIFSGIHNTLLAGNGISSLLFFIGTIFLMFQIEKNKNNSYGVILLLTFTFFMGLMLSRLLGIILGMHNGSQLVMTAFGSTSIIFGTMSILSNKIKSDLSNLHKFLFSGLLVLFIISLFNIFLKMSSIMITTSIMSTIIFSGFILVDLKRIIENGEDNYISATLTLYLDIYNLFSNLLILIGFMNNRED